MRRFLVINPNTSDEMTESIKQTVKSYVHKENVVEVIRANIGPRSLETFYEYSLATIGVINTFKDLDMKKYDGVLLACFGDPGLYALKEMISVPLIGIAEASISMALLLGDRFSIVTALEKAIPMMKNMVKQYGLENRMSKVVSLGMNVLDLEKDETNTYNALFKATKKCIREGAEVIILGCAGLTGFSDRIEKELGVTVIDPIRVGIKTLEAIVESDLRIARNGLYMPLMTKEIIGMNNLICKN